MDLGVHSFWQFFSPFGELFWDLKWSNLVLGATICSRGTDSSRMGWKSSAAMSTALGTPTASYDCRSTVSSPNIPSLKFSLRVATRLMVDNDRYIWLKKLFQHTFNGCSHVMAMHLMKKSSSKPSKHRYIICHSNIHQPPNVTHQNTSSQSTTSDKIWQAFLPND